MYGIRPDQSSQLTSGLLSVMNEISIARTEVSPHWSWAKGESGLLASAVLLHGERWILVTIDAHVISVNWAVPSLVCQLLNS